MNPAEYYAALKLLEAGLKPALAQAADAAEEYRSSVGAKSLETPYGDVAITRRKPTIAIVDEAGLLAWVADTMPNLLVTTVTTETRAWLTGKRLEVDGDDVVDPATGEAIPWAVVRPGSEFLTVRLGSDAKVAAAQSIAGRLDQVVSLLAIGDPS